MKKWVEMDDSEKSESIRALDASGLKTRGIAEFLGTTKSAVVGWCWRNKVTISDRTLSTIRIDSSAFVPADPVDPAVWLPLPGSVPASGLIGLQDGCCEWPVGDGFGSKQKFCGLPIGKRSSGMRIGRMYCEHHRSSGTASGKRRQLTEPREISRSGVGVADAANMVGYRAKRRAGAE